MDSQTLLDTAENVASRIEIDRIYRICYLADGSDNYRLIIIVPESSGMKFSQLEMSIRECTGDTLFTLYKVNDVINALNGGNLFFHTICQDENLLLASPRCKQFPGFSLERLMHWANAARERFTKSMARTHLFIDGVNFYKEHESDQAAFMLHQAAELTYRALEISFLGKEKKSHSIKHHQSYLLHHVPQLGIHFPVNTEDDLKLLKTFEKAYTDVRYRENFHFPAEHIGLMLDRVQALQLQGKAVFEDMIKMFEAKAHHSSNLETLLLTDRNADIGTENLLKEENESSSTFIHNTLQPEISAAVRLLIERTEPEQIYIFGGTTCDLVQGNLFCTNEAKHSKSFHYDILVLTNQERPYAINLENLINADPDQNLTVNLFYHQRQEALGKLAEGNRFFQTIFRHGKVVYSCVPILDKTEVPPVDLVKMVPDALKKYQKRSKRAAVLLHAADIIAKDDACVATLMLALCMEQKLLGAIYLLSGYIPNHHSLHHLVNTCTMLWPEAKDYLRRTDQDKAALSALTGIHSDVRYRTGNTSQRITVAEIASFCNHFIEVADRVCLSELEAVEKEIKTGVNINLVGHDECSI